MGYMEDCAYAAGVLDSEGTMGVYRYGGRVSIGTQDNNLLQWFVDRWGGYIEHHSGTRVNKWQMKADERINFLRDVMPYLQTKKTIALLVLEYLMAPKGEKPYTPDEYYEMTKKLNHELSDNWVPWVKELSTDKQGGE